jgi:hypothetical protein
MSLTVPVANSQSVSDQPSTTRTRKPEQRRLRQCLPTTPELPVIPRSREGVENRFLRPFAAPENHRPVLGSREQHAACQDSATVGLCSNGAEGSNKRRNCSSEQLAHRRMSKTNADGALVDQQFR